VKYKPPQPQSYSAETAALITQLKERIKRLEELGYELRECASRIGTVASGEGSVIRRTEEAIQAWDKEAKP
jgi:hypothetical protein